MEESNILLYQNEDGSIKVDVRLQEETVWLTQGQMCTLFGRAKSTISDHISNIFKEGELDKEVVVRDFRITTQHGAIFNKTQESKVNLYNLDVIISVGYRVKSKQGTQFRIWATQRLKEYIVKGFVLNDDRFESGSSMGYFSELQARIRKIRLSEKFFYQKVKDIYMTSIDYDAKNDETRMFFKIVQNKLLWAISQQTAAELVYRRVDASLPLMGMQSLDKKNVNKTDIATAKNYLDEEEIKLLGLLVEQYLAFAETQAQQQTPMYMKDWATKLDDILRLNGRQLLTHAGKISRKLADQKSSDEYSKYKTSQKKIEREQSLKELESDIKMLEQKKNENDRKIIES